MVSHPPTQQHYMEFYTAALGRHFYFNYKFTEWHCNYESVELCIVGVQEKYVTICFCSAHPNKLTCANQRACWTRHACVFSVQEFLCTKRSTGLSRSVCTEQCDYKQPNVVLICLTLCFLYSRKPGTWEKFEIQKEKSFVFVFST